MDIFLTFMLTSCYAESQIFHLFSPWKYKEKLPQKVEYCIELHTVSDYKKRLNFGENLRNEPWAGQI